MILLQMVYQSEKSMGYRNSSGKNGYVYILSNVKRTILYIGVTSELDGQIINHKNGKGSTFTAKYNLRVLLYFEDYPIER